MDRFTKFGIEFVYHITHFRNLHSILAHGLLSHNLASSHPHADISLEDVNQRRAGIVEPNSGKNLHHFVPLYFNPRNPMLYRRRNIQAELVILGFSTDLLLELDTVFTDGNAASGETSFSRDLVFLEKIDWECVWARYWNDIPDGSRKRCAEVLVPEIIETNVIEMIFCQNASMLERVNEQVGCQIESAIPQGLYF